MTLGETQQHFTRMIGQLIVWAYTQQGYGLTFGEAYRTPEQAKLDAAKGTGIAHSLHTDRLAVDFNLLINGVYQTETSAYQRMGESWEAMGGSWGGEFNDGNHFSWEYQGRK